MTQREIKKFNSETQQLQRLGQAEFLSLTESQAQDIKAKVLRAVSGLAPETAPVEAGGNFLFLQSQKFIRYVVSVLLGLSLVGGTAFASTAAKPGDLLYSVKRLSEKVQLGLAVSGQSKAVLQEKFAEERLVELQEISVKSSSTNSFQSVGSSQNLTASSTKAGEEIKVRAKEDANAAVSDAVEALKQVQDNLKSHGQNEAAASVSNNIIDLRLKAKAQGVSIPEDRYREPIPAFPQE